MKKSVDSQVGAARKEIRANIRAKLTSHELRSRLDTGLTDTMDDLLKHEGHPLNRLFALGRLDQTKAEHWRFLALIMVDEIFGDIQRGAPTKDAAPIKHLELLLYLNEIHRILLEGGDTSGIAAAVAELQPFLEFHDLGPGPSAHVERYRGMPAKTLRDYAHHALTEGAELLQSRPKNIPPALAEIVEVALDNFRPGWRHDGPIIEK